MDAVYRFTALPHVDELRAGEIDARSISISSWREHDYDDETVVWLDTYVVDLDEHPDSVTMVARNGMAHRLVVPELERAFEDHDYDDYIDAVSEYQESLPDGETGLTVIGQDAWEQAFDITPSHSSNTGTEGPQMNFWYPLDAIRDDHVGAAVTLDDLPLCVVEVDGETGLALTGGGQDLTWEIVEAYVRLGMLPPAYFARNLPAMADRGGNDRDRHLIAACLRSLTETAERATWAAKQLTEQAARWAGDPARA